MPDEEKAAAAEEKEADALTAEHAEADAALQEAAASTDKVEVFQEEAEAPEEGEWSWRVVNSQGEEMDVSSESFAGENLATADGAKSNPGLEVHTPDTKATVIEIEEPAGAKAKAGEEKE